MKTLLANHPYTNVCIVVKLNRVFVALYNPQILQLFPSSFEKFNIHFHYRSIVKNNSILFARFIRICFPFDSHRSSKYFWQCRNIFKRCLTFVRQRVRIYSLYIYMCACVSYVGVSRSFEIETKHVSRFLINLHHVMFTNCTGASSRETHFSSRSKTWNRYRTDALIKDNPVVPFSLRLGHE